MSTATVARPRRKSRRNIAKSAAPEFRMIPHEDIEPDPLLSRTSIRRPSDKDLARSLEQRGQLEPITVRPIPGREGYRIINGERRWRAAESLSGMSCLMCQIVDGNDESEVRLRRLAEALARDGIPLLDLGELIIRVKADLGWSLRMLADQLGVALHRVYRPSALARLSPAVQDMIRRGDLRYSHAFEIEKAPETEQEMIAKEVVAKRLTVKRTTALVRSCQPDGGAKSRAQSRRWEFSVLGNCRVVVTAPAGSRRSVAWRALRAAKRKLEEE